jgi:CheY-like chemotaxis protein
MAKVLMVDDEPNVRTSIDMLLSRAGILMWYSLKMDVKAYSNAGSERSELSDDN